MEVFFIYKHPTNLNLRNILQKSSLSPTLIICVRPSAIHTVYAFHFTCAQSVAQYAAYHYAYNFLARRQYDGRQLRSAIGIARPFSVRSLRTNYSQAQGENTELTVRSRTIL